MIMQEEKMLFKVFRENQLGLNYETLYIKGEVVNDEINYMVCLSGRLKPDNKNYFYDYHGDAVLGELIDDRNNFDIILLSTYNNHDESLKLHDINPVELLRILISIYHNGDLSKLYEINKLENKFHYVLEHMYIFEEIIPTIKSKIVMQDQEEKPLLVKDVVRELMKHDGGFYVDKVKDVNDNVKITLCFRYRILPEIYNNNFNYFIESYKLIIPSVILEKSNINNDSVMLEVFIADDIQINFDALCAYIGSEVENQSCTWYLNKDENVELLDYFESAKDIGYNKISINFDEVQINKYKLFYLENYSQILVNVDGNLVFCAYFWGCSRELYLTIKYKGNNITLLSTDYENDPVNTWVDKNQVLNYKTDFEKDNSVYDEFQLIKKISKIKFNTTQSPVTTKLKHFVVDEDGTFYLLGEAGDVNVGDDVLVCTKMNDSYQFTKQYWKVTSNDQVVSTVGLCKHNDKRLDAHILRKNVYKIYASTSDKILHSNTYIMKSKLLDYINYLGFGLVYNDTSISYLKQNYVIVDLQGRTNLNIDSVQPKESLTFIYNNMLHNCDVKGFKSPKLVLIGDNVNKIHLKDITDVRTKHYKGDFYLLEDQFNENCEYFIVDKGDLPEYGFPSHNRIFKLAPYAAVYDGLVAGYDITYSKEIAETNTRVFEPKFIKSIIGTTNKALGGKILMNTSMIFEVLDEYRFSINLETLDSGLHQSYYFLNRLLDDCFVKPLNSKDDDIFITFKTGLNGENEIKLPVIDGKINLNKFNHVSFFIKDIIIPEGVLHLSIKSTTISKLVLPSSLISLDATQCKDLSELIIPDDSKLKELTISFSLLTDLVIKQTLDKLNIIDNNKLESLSLLGYVKNINAHNNSLKTIGLVGGCEELNVSHNNLTELIIPDGCVNFNAKDNKLTNLVLSNTVQIFDVSNNNLLNLKTGTSVLNFNANNNKLVNVKLNKGLTNLTVDNNNITKLKLPNSCVTVYATNNPIKGLRLGQRTTGMYISKRPDFVTMNRKVFDYMCNKDKGGKLNIDFLVKLASS